MKASKVGNARSLKARSGDVQEHRRQQRQAWPEEARCLFSQRRLGREFIQVKEGQGRQGQRVQGQGRQVQGESKVKQRKQANARSCWTDSMSVVLYVLCS